MARGKGRRKNSGQLELFAEWSAICPPALAVVRGPDVSVPDRPAAELDDAALLAALPNAPLARVLALMTETGTRRLAAAVPVLAARCRLLVGHAPGRDLLAALDALAAIGGGEAAVAVTELVTADRLTGPALAAAVAAAIQLGVDFDRTVLLKLLGDDNAAVRAGACRCVRRSDPPVIAALEGLRLHHDRLVADAATCALGRLGRAGVRGRLMILAQEAPGADVVRALAAIPDHDALVLLSRLALRPDLRAEVLEALDGCDDPQAAAAADRIRQGDRAEV